MEGICEPLTLKASATHSIRGVPSGTPRLFLTPLIVVVIVILIEVAKRDKITIRITITSGGFAVASRFTFHASRVTLSHHSIFRTHCLSLPRHSGLNLNGRSVKVVNPAKTRVSKLLLDRPKTWPAGCLSSLRTVQPRQSANFRQSEV